MLRRTFALAGMLSLLICMSLPAQKGRAVPDTPGPPTTTLNVFPQLIPGNPVCWDFDTANSLHYKYDVGDPDEPFQNETYQVEGGTIIIENFDGFLFDFKTEGLAMTSVFVKAGNGGNLFTYEPAATADTGLHGPVGGTSGTIRAVSHVSFCYNALSTSEETAFARAPGTNAADDDITTCFLNVPGFNSPRWGWTMGPIAIPEDGEAEYTWPVYAAAGGCDLSKGSLVGEFKIVLYSTGHISWQFLPDTDTTFTEQHVYVGKTAIPVNRNNGMPTVAPGQYYIEEGLEAGDSVYVIAHAVAVF